MDGEPSANPFLAGNFAPLRSEDDFDLTVRGEIPRELRGALFRNGPNPQFEPLDPNHHWFLGDGMVHAFHVEDGRVRYRNRYVRTPKWTLENQAGRALFGGFNPALTDPEARGKDSGVANTNVVWHAGRLLALEEGHGPAEMSPQTLETRGYLEAYGGRVTAHPKLDPVTGEMLWFAYAVGEAPLSAGLRYGVTDREGRVVRRDDFQAPYCSMVHDFMATENHVVFPVLPLTGDMQRAMRGLPPFAWEPGRGAWLGVMRRDADVSTIRWLEVGAGYVFHVANAFEADGRIVCDVMRYDSAPLFPNPDGSPGPLAVARLVRWTIDPGAASGAVREEALDDLPGEFPRVDPRVETRPHRHAWFVADPSASPTLAFNVIAHLDLGSGRRQLWAFPEGDITSEAVFIPRAEDAAEGEGWLAAVVFRAAENRSDLVLVDALDVETGPIAVAELPRRIPFGFHGNWVGL